MRKLYLTFLYMCLLGFCGCGGRKVDGVSEIEYVPFKEKSDDLWGLISAKGEILFSNEFENMPSNVVDGLFTVEENGTFSLYKAESKPKLLRDGLKNVGEITSESDYIMGVCEDSRIFLMNKKGETVRELTDINGREIKAIRKYMTGGFYLAILRETKDSEESKVWLDDNFEIVYFEEKGIDEVCGSQDGKILMITDTNKNGVIIDKNGKTVLEIDKNYSLVDIKSTNYLKYGMVCIKDENSCAFMNMDGDINKCPNRVYEVQDFNKKSYIYKSKSGKYGVMSMNHDIIVRDKYDVIRILDNGYFARSEEVCSVFNESGELISEFISDEIPYLSGFNAFVKSVGSLKYLLDRKGEYIIKLTRNGIVDFHLFGTSKETTVNCFFSMGNPYGLYDSNISVYNDYWPDEMGSGWNFIFNDYTDWDTVISDFLNMMKNVVKNNMCMSIVENTVFDTSLYNPKNYNKKTRFGETTSKQYYNLETTLFFDSNMVYSNNDYSNKKYYWNSNSKVNKIVFNIWSESKLYNKLEKLLESGSFQIVRSGDLYTDGINYYKLKRGEVKSEGCYDYGYFTNIIVARNTDNFNSPKKAKKTKTRTDDEW